MAMTNTAEQQSDVEYISVDALNAMPLSRIFPAVAPAKLIAEGVSVGPVMTHEGEKYLVRFDGKVAQLARTEAEVLDLAGPSIRRHVGRIAYNRSLGEREARERQERAARIAACPGHQFVEREIARCLRWVGCELCGFGETVDSSD